MEPTRIKKRHRSDEKRPEYLIDMPKNRSDDEHATKNDSESDTRQGHAKWHKIRAAQTSSTGQHLACMICMLWQFRQFQSQAAQCRQTSGPNQFQKLGRRQFQLQSRLGQGLSKRLQRCRRCRLVVTSMLLKTHLVLQTLWKLQIESRY